MRHQFYLVRNPKAPQDASYIFHAKHPRFFAEIQGNDIVLADLIDEAPTERIESKLKRMRDWYNDYLINRQKYEGRR